MIPHFDVDIVIVTDGAVEVDAHTVVDGVACIHEYDPGFFAAASWKDAAGTAASEANELADIDARAGDEDAFDELAFEAQGELALELELGVNAAAEALCAAGCPTFASCRGHHDGSPRSQHPWILFAADRPRVELLASAARQTGCGLDVDERGLLVLYGPSVTNTVAFARAMIDRRSQFDALSPMVRREDARPDDDDDLLL